MSNVKTRVFAAVLLWLLGFNAQGAPSISIIYPHKLQKLSVAGFTFILGNVTPKDAKLTINGQNVPVYRTGGFLGYVPVKGGAFEFICKLKAPDGQTLTERLPVVIHRYKKPKTCSKSVIENSDYLPNQNIGILLGEELTFQCKTLPDKQVTVRLEQDEDSFPLYEHEVDGVKGIYRTTRFFYHPIRESSFRFEVPGEPSIKPFKPSYSISVLPPHEYPVLEVVEDQAKARYTPGGGYNTFLRKGTVVRATGYSGDWYRILLSKNHPVFVQKNQVNERKKGTAPSRTEVRNMNCWEDERNVYIKLLGIEPINGIWVEYPGENKIGFLMYQTTSNINRIRFQPGLKSLSDIKWTQVEEDVLLLDFFLEFPPLHGYFIEFRDGNALITVKKDLRSRPHSQIRICIDPGHGSGDTGATGPTGVNEKDATLKQALIMGALLKSKGYDVMYTRKNDFGPGLYDRAPLAFKENADIFISIHYNSTADGVNPYTARSTEVFYYNRLGKKLGEYIHPKIIKTTGLKDAGLKYGDLAVCRNNAVPSILMELDYIIIPKAEELIQTKYFQEEVADAVLDGINSYIKN